MTTLRQAADTVRQQIGADLRATMQAENLRRRHAYEALAARGLVPTKIERHPTDTIVVLRVPDTDIIAIAHLAHDPHFPSKVVAGRIRFHDDHLGYAIDLDGTVRAEAWLRDAETMTVRETSTYGGFVTDYLNWR